MGKIKPFGVPGLLVDQVVLVVVLRPRSFPSGRRETPRRLLLPSSFAPSNRPQSVTDREDDDEED